MEQTQDQSLFIKEPKPKGPKPKADAKQVEELEAKIEHLEHIVKMMCHYTGCNRILTENGIEHWKPGKQHMTKFKKAANAS